MASLFFTALVIQLCYVTIGYCISLVTKNNGLADVMYGPGIFLISLSTYILAPQPGVGATFILGAIFLWATRLALRIYKKNKGKPEDFRYKTWRDSWGKTFYLRSYFQIYLLQGIIMICVAVPAIVVSLFPTQSISPLLFVGLFIWVCGFICEAIADYQLDSFIAAIKGGDTSRGTIMRYGLWKYSRHPNYFGESLQWWGLSLAAFSVSTIPLIPFVSPILITFLLLKVSGVPLLEKHFEGNPEWEVYKTKTSVFIPLPPKQ